MAKTIKKHGKIALIVGLMIMLVAMYMAIPVGKAGDLTNREIKISDSRPSQTGVTYDVETNLSTTTAAKCLRVQFCTNASGSCSTSTIDLSSATKGDAADWNVWTNASWTIAVDNNNKIAAFYYETGETPSTTTDTSFSFNDIVNPSATTTNYAWIKTLDNTSTCTSTSPTGIIDEGVAAFAIIEGITVTATVAETLQFQIAGMDSETLLKTGVTTTVTTTATTLPFGELSTGSNTIGGHTLTISTNAAGGYTATTEYTNKLWIETATSSDIDDWTGTNATPTAPWSAGQEYWGYTTNDPDLGTGNTSRFGENDVWAGFSTTSYEVSYHSGPVSSTSTKMGYQAGISVNTDAGDYTTTIVYVCTPTY